MIETLYDIFKHWSEKGTVYLVSDTHFDDKEQNKLVPGWIKSRKFVKRINSKVTKNDTLIHLGDVGNPKWVKKIRGYKVLITGNHDRGATTYKKYFDEVYNGPLYISNKILLSHEPALVPYALNIHGHVHNGKQEERGCGCFGLNIAADVIGYKVVSLKEIIKSGRLKEIDSLHTKEIKKAKKRAAKRERRKLRLEKENAKKRR